MEKKKRITTGVTNITKYEMNKENPFVKQAIQKIENNIVKKYKSSTGTSRNAILQAVNSEGEHVGHTSFIRQIEVDEDQFAKIYLSNFSSFFNLKPQAIKVFGYILEQLVPNKDEFLFFIEDCLDYTKYKSDTSVRIGLTNLLENEIIARGRTEVLYYINPMVAFNGNRITFAKTYVKKQKQQKINPNQTLLDI